MLAHGCNPRTKEANRGASKVQDHPQLDIRSCFGLKKINGVFKIHNLIKIIRCSDNLQDIFFRPDTESQTRGQKESQPCLWQLPSLTVPRNIKYQVSTAQPTVLRPILNRA